MNTLQLSNRIMTGGALGALFLLNGLALGQQRETVKIEPLPRSVADIKLDRTPWDRSS